MHTMRLVGFLLFLLTAGCAEIERTPPESAAPPVGKAAAVEPEPSKTSPTDQSAVKTDSPRVKAPAKIPAEQPGKKPSVTPSSVKPGALPSTTPSSEKPGAPPLDLTALETRLKETKAIGVFTKITLKNQVDDLLNQFRAHYQGRAQTTLVQLRQPYDRLLLKVLSLLQDGDPELARAIVTSRETIWSILADPAKFASL